MFSNAPSISTVKPTGKGKSKDEVLVVGLEQLAAVDYVMKTLGALRASFDTKVKAAMHAHFVKLGCDAKSKPESFKGFEGALASASCEIRKRSTNSVVTLEEIELLDQHNISYEVEEKVVETFVINPAYADNKVLLAKVEAALKKVQGMPADFIMKQNGVKRTVVTEASVEQVFRLEHEHATKLLPLVTTLAVKPTMKTDDLNVVFDLVKPMLGLITKEEVEAFEKAEAAKKNSRSGKGKKGA